MFRAKSPFPSKLNRFPFDYVRKFVFWVPRFDFASGSLRDLVVEICQHKNEHQSIAARPAPPTILNFKFGLLPIQQTLSKIYPGTKKR